MQYMKRKMENASGHWRWPTEVKSYPSLSLSATSFDSFSSAKMTNFSFFACSHLAELSVLFPKLVVAPKMKAKVPGNPEANLIFVGMR